MKYSAFTIGAVLFLTLAFPAHAASLPSEIHIKPDGTFSATNAVVVQKAGTNLFSRVTWGTVYLRLTIITTSGNTPVKITKNNGGVATVDDIKEGDILVVKGTLAPGADTLLINAATIKDLSLNKEPKTFSGTVKSVDYSGSFVLPHKTLGNVKVLVDRDTTITKGVRTIALGEVSPGDKIVSLSGTYDYDTKTLQATSSVVYQDKAVFSPKNFEGKLKSIGSTLPTTLTVTVGKKDYTVYLAPTASVMSKSKAASTLQRYTVGDSVRFYGSIRQTNLLEIDSDSIRNLTF